MEDPSRFDDWYVVYLTSSDHEFLFCKGKPRLRDGEYELHSTILVQTEEMVRGRPRLKSYEDLMGFVKVPAVNVKLYRDCSSWFMEGVLKGGSPYENPFTVN